MYLTFFVDFRIAHFCSFFNLGRTHMVDFCLRLQIIALRHFRS